MHYVAAAKTDVGRKRKGNEDSFCLAPDLGLYVVADGMGGHAAGEVASRLAVETIREWMAKYLGGDGAAIVGPAAASGSPEASYLLSSIRLANRLIFDAAQGRQDYAGMGTTLVAVLTQGDTLMLAHVGDSRIYRIRDGEIAQVSRDHSFVQEQVDRGVISAEDALVSQYRHMITRALGLKETVEVDLAEESAVAGDVLLLCSDGLSDLLEDEEILTAVQEHAADLEQACQALVDRANHKGGDDNVTTLLIRSQAGNAGRRSAKGGAGSPTASAGGAGGAAVGRGGVSGWLKRVFRG